MSDESGRYTAEHTVMESGIEIRELKHLLEVKDNRIKELENEISKLRGLSSELSEDVSFPLEDESEDEFTEQLSFNVAGVEESEEEEKKKEKQLSFELH